MQKLFDDLTAADAAVQDFLTHYTAYLRAHVRFQLDRVQARAEAATGHAGMITEAAASHRRAAEAERQAEAQRNARRDEGETLQGRLAGLKNSEEYQAQGRIEDKRRELAAGAREVAGQRSRLGRDRRELGEAETSASKLARRAAEARAAESRFTADLTDAAQRSGITDDGFGPVDAGDDLLLVARARVAARRDDVGEIRGLLQAIRDARGRRGLREQDLGDKQTGEQRQEQAGVAAAARLALARQTAAAELSAWTGRWTRRWAGPASGPGDAQALGEALDHIGETGATSLTEMFDGRIAGRQADAITTRAHLETELREIRERLAGLRAERDAIAAEQDDAPPASDLRLACRDERPGAPLWQLVRFADGIGDAEAAAVEGALYGAGLLTAWIHPDPALTEAALAAAEADGYLLPSVPVTGRTPRRHPRPGGAGQCPRGRGHRGAPLGRTHWRHHRRQQWWQHWRNGPGGQHQGPVQLRRSRRCPAEGRPGVHRRDQRGRPPPRPARRIRRADQRHQRQRGTATPASWTGLARCSKISSEPGECRIPRRSRRPPRPPAPTPCCSPAPGMRPRRPGTALDAAIAEVDARTRQLRQAAAERRMPIAAEQVTRGDTPGPPRS